MLFLNFVSDFCFSPKLSNAYICQFCFVYIVMSLGTGATEEDGAIVAKLFAAVGKILKADEKMFDAVTGLRYIQALRLLICLSCSIH